MPLTDNSYSNRLHDVLEKPNIRKANEVGLSLGGWMALNFAIRHRDKVNRLVVISPAGIGKERVSFLFCALFYGLLPSPQRIFLIGEGHALVKVTREVYIFYFIMN